jgi:hypothetical protein
VYLIAPLAGEASHMGLAKGMAEWSVVPITVPIFRGGRHRVHTGQYTCAPDSRSFEPGPDIGREHCRIYHNSIETAKKHCAKLNKKRTK